MMSLFLNKKVENSCIGTAKINNIDVIYIGSEINFAWMLSVTSAIDRPKSVPQLPYNRMCISILNILIFNKLRTQVIIRLDSIKMFYFILDYKSVLFYS